MDKYLENIQLLNGSTKQSSAYKDEFLLAEVELKMESGGEDGRWKEEKWEEEGQMGGQILKYMGRSVIVFIPPGFEKH